ncbi:hypothetical protein [Nostoc sp.]
MVDAQLNTVDITAKRDRIEQARVYRVQVVWLPDERLIVSRYLFSYT